jgi:hypothetical protein
MIEEDKEEVIFIRARQLHCLPGMQVAQLS